MHNAVKALIRSRFAWILFGPALLVLALAGRGWCGAYSFDQRPERERLVFKFDGKLPHFEAARTGATEILLALPTGMALAGRAAPGTDLGRSRLVAGVAAADGGVRITLKDPGFGFVVHALPDTRKLVVDIFRDPLGARWKPSGAVAPATPAAKPEPKAEPARNGKAESPAPPAKNGKAEAKAPVNTAAAVPAGKGQAKGSVAAPAAPNATPAAPPAPEASQVAAPAPVAPRPFYAVPYVFRGKVRSVGPEDAAPVSPQAVPAPSPQATAAAPQAAPAAPAAPAPEIGRAHV